jgi:uncharacterized iron-regulated membrane protein
MNRSIVLALRNAWLQVHKWIGLLLAVVIIPLSVSGALLVWDEPVDRLLNPGRYAVSGAPALEASDYAAAAQSAVGGNNAVVSLRYPDSASGPVVATATSVSAREPGGRPERTNVWLDPVDGRVLDVASSNAGALRFLRRLHGSLLVPGAGRTIVGVVGAAMFVSCLTGLWLWWPLKGSVVRGLRWRRRNATSANLHHAMGFWILVPLAMLSFTGAWISFPQFFERFDAGQSKHAAPPDRARAARAMPLVRTRTDVDVALSAARPLARDGRLTTISWPTDQAAQWKIAFATDAGTAEIAIDDATGQARPSRQPAPETTARLMRRLHDGTGMGTIWQTLIFLGGIIPALLAVTGIMMWLRTRSARLRREKRRKAELAPLPAE